MAVRTFYGFEYADDALDPKTRNLCSMVAAAAAGCPD